MWTCILICLYFFTFLGLVGLMSDIQILRPKPWRQPGPTSVLVVSIGSCLGTC